MLRSLKIGLCSFQPLHLKIKVNGRHEWRLSHKSEEVEALSVTWPLLSSGQHNAWLIAALKTPHLKLEKSALDETYTVAYFLTIKAFTKGEKESADAWELSSWISVFFLILLSTACLIFRKSILHSCVCLLLNRLEISSPLIDLEKQT